MSRTDDSDVIGLFQDFYSEYCAEKLETLATKYPTKKKSLYIDWQELSRFDSDLADDFRNHPKQFQGYAEEALRLCDLPTDVKLGRAHVRVTSLPETTKVREIQTHHRGKLLTVRGIVHRTSDINSWVSTAAFECQRCGTLTRIPQTTGDFQEPHECQGCERQGPFRINYNQSEFVDIETIDLLDDPAALSDGTVPEKIIIKLEDDIAGKVAAGDRVCVTGIVQLQKETNAKEQDGIFAFRLSAVSIGSPDTQSEIGSPDHGLKPSDLDTYTAQAATALSTLPEDAREEETKAKLVTPFIEALGWNKYDSTEVRLEYTDSKTRECPDYALFGPDSDIPDIIVEAKQIGANLREKEEQLYDYLRVFSAEWGVLTNGKEFYIYHRPGDDYLPKKLAEVTIEDLSDAEIVSSLLRDSFY